MRIQSVRIENFKCFEDTGDIELGDVTVFVGPNNSGKTSILQSLVSMHYMNGWQPDNGWVRLGAERPRITLQTDEGEYVANSLTGTMEKNGSSTNRFGRPASPRAFVPLLSHRVRETYAAQISRTAVTEPRGGDFRDLVSKISAITHNPESKGYRLYRQLCLDFLGAVITTHPDEGNRSQVGLSIEGLGEIRLQDMGSGVPQIVGLITELIHGSDLVFIVDQIEMDLHPEALDRLLDVMLDRLPEIQLVVTTHSAKVVRRLGERSTTKMYEVSPTTAGGIPTSMVQPVGADPLDRLAVLERLGHSVADTYARSGWIIFEESSAERIVRDYLIPWFVPGLRTFGTVGANGVSDLDSRYRSFRSLYTFAHLDPPTDAWVIADGDDAGASAIGRLQEAFEDARNRNRFRSLSQRDFEGYYPANFQGRVDDVLATIDKKQRRLEKRNLLNEVVAWLDEDETRAKKALRSSAAEVISVLESIEQEVSGGR